MTERQTNARMNLMTEPGPWVGIRRGRFVAMLAVSLVIGASGLWPIDSGAAPKTSAAVTIAKVRDEWVQDLRTKQFEPILKLYTADASFLQPNGDRLSGSAALRSLFQMIMATFSSDLTLHSHELDVSSDLAYDSGDFEEALTTIATGAKIDSKGSYIMIFKRQPNGTWLIVQQVFTGTPPAGT